MTNKNEQLLEAVERLTKETLAKRLTWKREFPPAREVEKLTGVTGLFTQEMDELRDYYTASYAGLKCVIYRVVPTHSAVGLLALNSKDARGQVLLELFDPALNQKWTVEGVYRVESLLEAVKKATASSPPPPDVLQRILDQGKE